MRWRKWQGLFAGDSTFLHSLQQGFTSFEIFLQSLSIPILPQSSQPAREFQIRKPAVEPGENAGIMFPVHSPGISKGLSDARFALHYLFFPFADKIALNDKNKLSQISKGVFSYLKRVFSDLEKDCHYC